MGEKRRTSEALKFFLSAEYEKSPYPTSQQLKDLAENGEFSRTQIRNWFESERQRVGLSEIKENALYQGE